MDIPRTPRPNRSRYILIGGGVAAMLLVTLALRNLEPRAPSVDRATLYIDSVSRGPMVREVRASGTLVPERMVYVSAVTAGRVEALPLRPGVTVDANTVLVTLTNPDVQLQDLEGQRQLTAAEQALLTLRSNLEQQRLQQEAVVASLITQHNDAQRRLREFTALDEKGLASANEISSARDQATELGARLNYERERLRLLTGSVGSQIRLQEDQVARMRAIARFNRERIESMEVKAGEPGVLQELPLELGQWVLPGQRLARVAQPGMLKAVLRVQETQARDISIGQRVAVDMRTGQGSPRVPGSVMRIDPIVQGGTVIVEIALEGELPRGARADLSVDGVIEIDRIDDALYTGRPGYGTPESTIGMWKLEPDGKHASRVQVQLGRASVSTIEIRGGLQQGDRVIISDMSQWDNVNRVRLQ